MRDKKPSRRIGILTYHYVINEGAINVSLDQISVHNPRLVNGHLERNPYRKDFYKLLELKGFQVAMEKYLKPFTLFQKCLLAPKYGYRILLRYIRSLV